MHDLKKIGIKLAIDDFGTGFSALSYLKRFPVDGLKIHRSFIEGLNYDDGDMAIVKAVIAFARTLHLKVTAEGVETPDQLRHLRQLGCDLGQGYYFATPLPGMEMVLDTRYGTGTLSLVETDDSDGRPAPRILHHTG
jgi:EAL domain-containing protein (putative c-di-GMP-specific phosphodiesterase class I)